MPDVQRLEEMSWYQAERSLERGVTTVVVAAGAMEQHGPHMPMAVDNIIGNALADGVAARLENALRGPTIPLGVSAEHMELKGTITLDKEGFKAIVRQYVYSLAHHGFTAVLIIPSHGGNFGPLAELREETGGEINGARYIPYVDLEIVDVMNRISSTDGITPEIAGAHAGEAETSIVLAERPDLVEMARSEAGFVGVLDEANIAKMIEGGVTALSANGILGDARAADAERGCRYINGLSEYLAGWFSERLAKQANSDEM
jgi:creatinine amidohydrolase